MTFKFNKIKNVIQSKINRVYKPKENNVMTKNQKPDEIAFLLHQIHIFIDKIENNSFIP